MGNRPRFGFVVEYVRDLEAAKRFYVDTLGLPIEREAPTFVQFGVFALASDEPLSGTNGPELYWLVNDAEAAYAELSAKAPVSVPLKQMPYGKVFAIEEPAGKPRFLIELAEARPSQPV